MTKEPTYTITNSTINIVWEGKAVTVQSGQPNFIGLKNAILEKRWDDVPSFLTTEGAIHKWAHGKFEIKASKEGHDAVFYNGEALPTDLNERIVEMATRNEDPTPLFNFWERLQKNPSWRSVQQLWPFLRHKGIPLTKAGYILAYKGLKENFMDCHTGKVDNRPGTVHEMARNLVSDDPDVGCHFGYHVGALNYARGFSNGQLVVCKVDPADVVCIPKDSSYEKMRVCKYKVIGVFTGQLPSTVFDDVEPETKDEEVKDPLVEKKLNPEIAETEEDETKPAPKTVKVPKKFKKFMTMSMAQLLEQSIDDLRQFATHGLHMIGASKIPGGKATLSAKIIELRDSGNYSSGDE